MCWVSEIANIMSRSSVIVENQLPPTFVRSSSASTSSTPLKACLFHARALPSVPCFSLDPIGKCSIHHQFVSSAVALIMPYQETKVEKQLLRCLYKLLQQIIVICGMFSCYLTYSAPQRRPRTWSCLGLQPQRHCSSSNNIFNKD